jgi:hypothetical protein
MSWKRILLLAVGLLVLVGTAPAGGAAKRFNTYITCGPPRHHDSVCVSGDAPRAVIVSFRHANVRYRLCVKTPTGRRNCRSEQTGPRGTRDLVFIAAGRVGRYVVTWRAGGKLVDRDSYRLEPEPA